MNHEINHLNFKLHFTVNLLFIQLFGFNATPYCYFSNFLVHDYVYPSYNDLYLHMTRNKLYRKNSIKLCAHEFNEHWLSTTNNLCCKIIDKRFLEEAVSISCLFYQIRYHGSSNIWTWVWRAKQHVPTRIIWNTFALPSLS